MHKLINKIAPPHFGYDFRIRPCIVVGTKTEYMYEQYSKRAAISISLILS